MNIKSSSSKGLNVRVKAKPCGLCGDIGDREKLMVCANCTIAEHTYCVQDMLFSAPVGDWLCDKCRSKTIPQTEGMERKLVSPNNSKSVSFQLQNNLASQSPTRGSFQSPVKKCGRYVPGNGKVKYIPSEELCSPKSGSRAKQQNTGQHTASVHHEFSKKSPPRSKASTVAISSASLNPHQKSLPSLSPRQKSFASLSPSISSNSFSVASLQKTVKPHLQGEICGKMPSFLLPSIPPDVAKRIKLSVIDKPSTNSPKHTSSQSPERKTHLRLVKVKDSFEAIPQGSDVSLKRTAVPDTEAHIADANANNIGASMDEAVGVSRADSLQAKTYTVNSPISPKLTAFPGKIYPHNPAKNAIWKGSFEVLVDGVKDCCMYEGVCAYTPLKVSKKAFMTSRKLPNHLKFKLVSRRDVWPDVNTFLPSLDDIALYFFPGEINRSTKKYDDLLEHIVNHDLALVLAVIGAELLIFTSKQLCLVPRSMSKVLGMQAYLWGVYRPMKKSKNLVVPTLSDHDLSDSTHLDELEFPPGFPEKRVSKGEMTNKLKLQNKSSTTEHGVKRDGKVSFIDCQEGSLEFPPGFPGESAPKDEMNKLKLQNQSSSAEFGVKTDETVSPIDHQEGSPVANVGLKYKHNGEQVTTRDVGLESEAADKYLKCSKLDAGQVGLPGREHEAFCNFTDDDWVEDMEIDMIGDKKVGRIDVVVHGAKDQDTHVEAPHNPKRSSNFWWKWVSPRKPINVSHSKRAPGLSSKLSSPAQPPPYSNSVRPYKTQTSPKKIGGMGSKPPSAVGENTSIQGKANQEVKDFNTRIHQNQDMGMHIASESIEGKLDPSMPPLVSEPSISNTPCSSQGKLDPLMPPLVSEPSISNTQCSSRSKGEKALSFEQTDITEEAMATKQVENESTTPIQGVPRDSCGEIDLNIADTPVMDCDLGSQWIEIMDDNDDVFVSRGNVLESKGTVESQMELGSERSYTAGNPDDNSISMPRKFLGRPEETSVFTKTTSPESDRTGACLELFPLEAPNEPQPDAPDCDLELGVGLPVKNLFPDDWGDPVTGFSAIQITRQGPYWVNLKKMKKNDGCEEEMLKL